MSEKLYKKNSLGEFVEVGYEFSGWPSNGTWLVKDGRNNCIIPIKGVPEMPTPSLVSYMQYQDELTDYLMDLWNSGQSISLREIARLTSEFFAIKAGGIKLKDEIIEN